MHCRSLSLFQQEVAVSSAVRCTLCKEHVYSALHPSACVKIWLAQDRCDALAANALSPLNV